MMKLIIVFILCFGAVLINTGAQDIRPGYVFRLQTLVNSGSKANIQKQNESGVSFNGDNFVEFQTYHQRVSKFNFRFNVRPRNNQNSVLLYVAQSRRIGDFVALIIKNSHYEFRFKSGIFMDIIWSKGVEVNKWTSISCGYENGVGCLKVGNLSQISQLTINLIHYMVWDTNLYIGGYDYHITMNKEVGADRGFDGCISDFEVLSQKIDMRSAINSANIQYCEETVPEVPSNQPVQEHECSGRNCKVVYVDPCSVQNPCENNGICENNGNTKICHCPIHFTGEYCQHSAPVTYSSQYTGNSYIELNKSTIVKSPAEEYISLVVSFSTMEPNGLLIWYGQPNGVAHNGQDFIALAVVGGFLEITFLFSGNERSVQMHTRVDDGMRHNAVLYRNGNSASVIFDNKRIFLETLQPTKSYLDFSGNIFIGGALNIGEFTGNRYVHGFKGCIVVYDENVPLNMSNSDVSGYNIIPCSESCLENSRHCVDGTVLTTTSATPTKVPVTTKCSQVTCGTGLCRNTNLGFECFCPLNKTGDRCQYSENLDNNNLSFNGRSFISFKLANSFENIQFYVRPRNNQDSILLYAAQFHYNGVGNFVALIIKDRKYEFKLRTDFELVTIYSEEEVDINKWTLISLGYENSVGFLKVGNSQKIIRHAIKRFNNIQLGKNLYIGGFDNRITLNMEVGANRGFDGCISELDIFYQKIDMINSIKDSANVQNCAYNGPEAPVQSIPQLHSVPSVQSSTEVCSPGYSGYNCDKIIDPCLAYDLCENNGICESNGNTSICDCPIHFTGEHCQHSAPITFSSQYRGTGFIELRRSAQLIAYSQNSMSLGISFSTKEPNGLLMWIGQIKGIAYNGQDFIALAVVNGLLELTFHLSGQTSFVRSDTRVDNGVFHVAILERRSNRFTLKLDYLSFNGETIYGNHNLLGNIFIGGAPEISKFTSNRYNQGFNGCIYIVKRNSKMRVANISNSIVSGYNVIPCPEPQCPPGYQGIYPNCYQSTPPPTSPSTTTPLPEFAPTPSTPGACSADEWQCDNGKCINAEFKCDGLLDCIDNSDETEKNCPLESVGSENVSENLPFLPEVQATNTSSHSPVVWNELHKTAHLACTNYSNLPMQIPQRTEFTPRIYGGVIAKRGEFPWMAALGYININPGGITYDCGGTIISAYFVLTAGHCATPNRSPILVKLGKIDLTDDIDTTNYEIQKIVRHPDYSRLKNDIALIRVKNSISFTTEIRPVCLHMPEYDINFEEDLTLPGWGKTESNKKSNYLLKTKLKMMPLSECNETIKLYWREGINERHYCAYDPLGKNDACEGDSGGPLQYFNSDSNITTVVGIVSSGNGCGGLGIYTRVAYYLGWIESIVWPHNEQQSN